MFVKAHYQWVVSHPVINIELFFAVVIIFGVFTYYFCRETCNKIFKEVIEIKY